MSSTIQTDLHAGFIRYIAGIIPVSDALNEAVLQAATVLNVKKGTALVQPGKRCPAIHYIHKGLLRGFYHQENKEITNWLATEGEFATSLLAFLTSGPSMEGIEALEDSQLTVLSHTALQQLYTNFPEMERLGRVLTENYYIRLENRLQSMQFTTAQERFDQLMARNSSLFYRAPLGHIASYLGITQETLSRIRARQGGKAIK